MKSRRKNIQSNFDKRTEKLSSNMKKAELPEHEDDSSIDKSSCESEEAPEVYSITKAVHEYRSGRREFIARSSLAGAALSLGAGGLTGCQENEGTEKVMKSIHSITTRFGGASYEFSPDSKILAVYNRAEADVNLYSLPDAKLVRTLMNENEYPGVSGLYFTSDGRYLVALVYNRINIWSLTDGVLIKTIADTGDPYSNHSYIFALNPDGKTLAYKQYPDPTIKICSIPDGTLLNTIPENWSTGSLISFSPDGKRFISAYQGTIRIYSFPELVTINTIETDPGFVYFSFNPDGTAIASAMNGIISLWSFPEGNLLKTFSADASYAYFAFSNDGKLLATRGSDTVINIWSIQGGNIYYSLSLHTEKVNSIFFSSDGKYFASSQLQAIILWSVGASGFGIIKRIEEHGDTTTDNRWVSISPDSRILASSLGKKITLWSIPDCEEISAGGCICDTVCTCNTVTDGNGPDICTCNSVQFCTCNAICTCNAVCSCDAHTGGGGQTYWYPN